MSGRRVVIISLLALILVGIIVIMLLLTAIWDVLYKCYYELDRIENLLHRDERRKLWRGK
jgi:hypothetical protein